MGKSFTQTVRHSSHETKEKSQIAKAKKKGKKGAEKEQKQSDTKRRHRQQGAKKDKHVRRKHYGIDNRKTKEEKKRKERKRDLLKRFYDWTKETHKTHLFFWFLFQNLSE